ncbi:TonB family protein [Brevundimonas sp.]|uniref:TonB family protein n=1 Tax=Brevundimonas sp. TaxID=1871086 RepID=UPI002ED784D5
MERSRHAMAACAVTLALGAAGCAGASRPGAPEAGYATIECAVASDGRATNCRVLSESPAGQGFGAAALDIVQRGRLSARTVEGAEGAKFVVRVPFMLATATTEPPGQVQTPVEGRPDHP